MSNLEIYITLSYLFMFGTFVSSLDNWESATCGFKWFAVLSFILAPISMPFLCGMSLANAKVKI